MPVYQIPVHGLLGSPESPEDKATYFTFDAFLLHVNKAKAFDTIDLDIASDGGFCDVADKMITVLKATKKIITSHNSGNVCSAATKLFTLPVTKEQRFYDPAKGLFLIHNPWGKIEGDATELANASKELQSVEGEYAKWYAAATGADLTVIKAYMSENVPLTPDQVESLGFATVVKPTVNAVAKLKSTINFEDPMENKEVAEKLNGFDKLLQKIYAKLGIKAIMLSDANGKELEFPDLVDPAEVKVGVKVNEGGKPANGEYPQPDGTILVCKDGVLTEVKPKPADDAQALKAEIEKLKGELEKANTAKAQAETKAVDAIAAVKELDSNFKTFKAQFTDGKPADATPPAGGGKKYTSKEDLEKMI